MFENYREPLKQSFQQSLLQGKHYARITDARLQAETILGESIAPGSPLAKIVDEAIEAAVVRTARILIKQSETTHQAYDRLVNLLERQPNLSVRSSTSVLQQAYSTPIPIAYLASVLADINSETTVYEPTAGNGALLIAANPAKVIANEINADRFAELSTQGYRQLTQKNAIEYRPQEPVDRVICNPPFGSILDANQHTQRFQLYDIWTTQIDQAIALNALSILKDEGRAVLIIGGKQGSDEALRSDRYNTRESRAFYYILYNHYNVIQHFSIWGDLYRKQGAGFPIDLVVIQGRGKSQRSLPAVEVPTIYNFFAELKELIPNESIHRLSPTLDTRHNTDTVSRKSSRLRPDSGRNDVQNADAAESRVDDSALDGGYKQYSVRNSDTLGQNSDSTYPDSTTSRDTTKRRPAGRSEPMAKSVGRKADSRQRSLHRDAVDVWNARLRISSRAVEQQSSGVSRFAGSASGDLSGGMANDTDSLTRQPVPETVSMEAIEQARPEQAPDNLTIQPKQVPYLAKSKGMATQTLIPYNMASAAQTALDQFERQYGDIDQYLAARLGYASTNELHKYFSAEQVDAAALAISNLERGSGFITGDQTGVGKGRICASIMRYAHQQGKVAIFVTQKATLYADMMRDVSDIGMHRFYPFATDTKAKIPLPNGQELTTGGAAQQEKIMREMMFSRNLTGYSAIFTTYSQLQTVGKKEPLRRDFLRSIAPNAILILDEAHEAGGSSSGWKESGPVDRAEFVRELVDLASGVFYSSATYAKRPDVMDLYARRTDLRLGVSRMEKLENLLHRGGVPLQQIVASKFVASGQMLRRERSYEGIRFQAKVVTVDREIADQFSAAMRAIKDFDKAKLEALKELNRALKAEAKALGQDNTVGEAGAKSTNFTSLMHNCIEQGLLAQKAEATVQEAIQALQQGQKPVIALASTMGSFIESYAELHNLKHGDRIELSFSNLLERYLERSRDVTIRDYRGQISRHRLSDAQLGDWGLAAYEEALECIQDADFSTIPISPIDYISQRLEREGYSIREVTGRKVGLDYAPDGSTTYKIRPDSDRTARARIDAVAQFNSGDADIILLNCSGSTGISLHASEKFADRRSRHMIVAQAERDINVFMQMLGRVHRTGQVALPSYTLLMGDLPAEKRPGAILCRKMASLNANTTASRETDISVNNVVDFMNSYGEQVIFDLLNDDPELNAKLDFPMTQAENDSSEIALIKRVTGRIPLLPIAEQEEVYSLIEAEYKELVEQARAMGESILEADQLDLEAKTIARMEAIPDESNIRSEFTGSVYLEVVDAKSAAKPLTQLQVINIVRSELELAPVEDLAEHDRPNVAAISQQKMAKTIAQLEVDTERYRQEMIAQKRDESAILKFNEKLDKQLRQVQRSLEGYPSGTPVQIITPATQNVLYGVIAGVDHKSRPGSPAAANRWKIRILVADSAKQIILPLSKFNTGRQGAAHLERQERDWFNHDVYSLFDKRQESGRINRQIFTGNLIRAFEKYPKGKLVNYTDDRGEIHQGLIMPKGFNIQSDLEAEPVAFQEPAQVKAFITDLTDRKGAVKTLDELLIVRSQFRGEDFLLQAPRARDSGGKYYLDEALLTAAGSDFHSVGDRMEVVVPSDRLEQTLDVIMKQRGYPLAAFDYKELARDYLGIKLPELEILEAEEFEQQNYHQSADMGYAMNRYAIATAKLQKGIVEKRIADFLEAAGLRESVTEGESFHLRIENEPYMPLVIERHNSELYFTHYAEQNGDMFIDSEMVFTIQTEGQLQFQETAVQDPIRGGELRSPDRLFARLFSRNILEQGFAEVARAKLQSQQSQQPESDNQTQRNSDTLHPTVQRYLEIKDSHAEAIALIKVGDFYETVFEDAKVLADRLEIILTSRESGDPQQGRIPLAGFPVRALDRYVSELVKEFTVVTAEESGAITVHPQQPLQQSNLTERADRVREIDLEIVAAQLGLERDCHDKHRWRNGDRIISISGSKFMDWLADKGGGGAIDLVMQVQGVDFKEAVEWLSRQPVTPQSVPQLASQPRSPLEDKPLEMPAASEYRWNAVRDYLTETRKLPAVLVDRLHDRGLIYADELQNVVFVRHATRVDAGIWQRTDVTGASLRGTWGEANSFHGLAAGSSREEGWFWIGLGKGEVKRVMLTESAIDALSLSVLDRQHRSPESVTIYLSTDGSGAIPTQALQQVLAQGGQVAIAFDADLAGERMAWQVAQALPGVRRIMPAYGKDWNERLVWDGQPERANQPAWDKPMVRSLWRWLQAAERVGRSAGYLQRIVEVAKEQINGEPLSEQAVAAMRQDLQRFQKQPIGRAIELE